MKKLLLLLLLSLPCWAQNMRFDAIAWGPRGPVPGATVAVCTQPATTTTQPCSPLASLCSSLSDNVCSQPNPLTADSLGNYHFYAKTSVGPYTVQIYGPQVAVPYVLTDQYLNGTLVSPNLSSPTLTNPIFVGSGDYLLNFQGPLAPITGNGSSQTVYTYTLPASTLATNKGIHIRVWWNHSTGTASVSYAITLNGVTVLSPGSTATGGQFYDLYIWNTASTTGTFSGDYRTASAISASTNPLAGLAWTSNQTIAFSFGVANTDAITPQGFEVDLIQ